MLGPWSCARSRVQPPRLLQGPALCKLNVHETEQFLDPIVGRKLEWWRSKSRRGVQGYLAHKKQRPPRTLQKDYAWVSMVVLGRGGGVLMSEAHRYMWRPSMGGERTHHRF